MVLGACCSQLKVEFGQCADSRDAGLALEGSMLGLDWAGLTMFSGSGRTRGP